FPRFTQPMWDGSPLAGRTILLHAEQGMGDTFQFIRYAAAVKERGGRVIAACPDPMVRIIATCPGVDQAVSQSDRLPPFDFHVPLLSLPYLLRTDLTTIPASIPYLFADPERVEHWRAVLGSRTEFKIGITWQGNPKFKMDRLRSIPLTCFAPLAQLP